MPCPQLSDPIADADEQNDSQEEENDQSDNSSSDEPLDALVDAFHVLSASISTLAQALQSIPVTPQPSYAPSQSNLPRYPYPQASYRGYPRTK